MEPNATDYEKGVLFFGERKKCCQVVRPTSRRCLTRERERGGKTMALEPKVPFYWLHAANDLERMREGNLRGNRVWRSGGVGWASKCGQNVN